MSLSSPEESPPDSPSLADHGVVAIVGRPNVGKSALFNRLAGRRISIVHDQPGVTRDRITARCQLGRRPFTLIDTGGIGGGADESFSEQVRLEADIAMEAADLILLVVDIQDGLTPVDRELARALRATRTPVVVVANKVDHDSHQDAGAEFSALGFGESLQVSAAHGRGIGALVAHVETILGEVVPESAEEAGPAGEEPMRVAIVGKPNAGKSSLINAVLNDTRTIVSEIAGTTRDAVDIPYERDGRPFVLIDTAGIRKKTRRDSTVEVFSAMRTEQSIHRAHLCVLVIDSATGITAQDRKIARMILGASKPCVVALNKFDLYHPDAKFHDRLEVLRDHVGTELFFLDYAPMVAVSASKREYLGTLFKAIEQVRAASADLPGTGELNRLVERALTVAPPPSKKGGARLKVLYATLAKKEGNSPLPVPRFVLFVNKRSLMPDSYRRFLENEIRRRNPLRGLPIRFDIRERDGTKRPARRR